jgi:pimeloyl-ACP methyl ester carboxylesterase
MAPKPLPPALAGAHRMLAGAAGPVGLYADGSGPPLLLLHSINAAASAYEVRPLYDRLCRWHRVFAPDLPGYGSSDRSDRRYDIRLFVDAVHQTVDAIRAEAGPAPIDALAISLSCEFLARAAVERPDHFRTLTFVTPTGFATGSEWLRGPPGSARTIPIMTNLVRSLPGKTAIFRLLVRKGSVRYFLKRTYGSDRVHEDMVDYDVTTANRPGGHHAPFAFLSGRLFSADVRDLYERITHPVWVPHGTRGDFKDFSRAEWAAARPNWSFQPFPTGALVHWEETTAFVAALEGFLERGAVEAG